MRLPPGFPSYLRRTYPSAVDFDSGMKEKEIAANTSGTSTVKEGDVTVAEIKNSSSITRLEYNSKTRALNTTFKNGVTYTYKNVSAELFEKVAHPSTEFDYSVGKAHSRLIAGISKVSALKWE